ncbi:hypothetical protein EAH89_21320 [Roseomonas nepalensis]|uniref:Uncharacterized protein n=1 Tax=Muricoccus nepalensis TaxID=1854500 RepID=A0A502FJY3_9PROT|nr:hypothetical protein [Roseomonas nepalensis]TPG49552.1 hypothetical protein EAH89_21320 [Roseomonas nepalensis]
MNDRAEKRPTTLTAGRTLARDAASFGSGEAHHAAIRARLELLLEEVIEALDALDAFRADMEPDQDGEAEPDEESAQPAALTPDRAPSKVLRFPRRPRAVQVTA